MVTSLYVFNLIKQILTFYDSSNFVFFFFFNFSKKKTGFYKLSFRFFYFNSISRIPTPIHRIPTPIPRILTQITRIPFQLHLIPFPFPHIPRIPRHSTQILLIPTPIPPIPRISLIPFPDSLFWLLQIAIYKCL